GIAPIEGFAVRATASSERDPYSNAASQAVGSPSVEGCGDLPGAWSPATDGPGDEWLQVAFATPVRGSSLRVHETNVGGFVARIELIDSRGVRHPVWEGAD